MLENGHCDDRLIFKYRILLVFFFNSLFKLIIFNIKIIRARAEPLQPINKFKKRKKIKINNKCYKRRFFIRDILL